ncbi:uncharacterized protein [Leptinotarsa decemlineata]|uniref:uncharacterized protein n=1 Tax=Leptinotarsa decemlineata TaxID=7539 RepID=UPI003D308A1C
MQLKILQVNVDRRRNAHHLIQRVVLEEEIDIVLVQEPNKTIVSKDTKWIVGKSQNTAIWCKNKACGITGHETGNGFVNITFKDWSIYNCYISPDVEQRTYEKCVDRVMQHARQGGKEAIFAGDFNAKSTLWNSTTTDRRGEYLADWVQALNLTVENKGNIPTFVRGAQNSIIDITLSTQKMASKVTDWRVSTEESMSLHRHIFFKVQTVGKNRRKEGFVKCRIDKELLIDTSQLMGDNISTLQELNTALHDAQKAATSWGAREERREEPVWWNDTRQSQPQGKVQFTQEGADTGEKKTARSNRNIRLGGKI